MSQFWLSSLGVAGAAADARKTSGAARHAAGTRELAAGATADTRNAALSTRTATGTIVLAAGATVAARVAAAAARVLLEDRVSGCRTDRAGVGLSCRHRHHSNRCSNSSTNDQRFEGVQFRYHARLNTHFHTRPKPCE